MCVETECDTFEVLAATNSRKRASVSEERNSLSGRVRRYAKVGAGVGGVAARYAGQRALGRDPSPIEIAGEMRTALGGLKGPIMKVAQMIATIPNALPEGFSEELAQLQSNAPAMGWAFVKRRMRSELGSDWQKKFSHFERESAAAASLGQVHKAESLEGQVLACKLQYPDMQSAVEADLKQLNAMFSVYRRLDKAIDPGEISEEVGARLREELDYELEARHMALFRLILSGDPAITVPESVPDLSTKRLLTMTWHDGDPLLSYKNSTEEVRNSIAQTMFRAWWIPFNRYGVIHGDPHLGNYSIRETSSGYGINLLDFGCVRTFRLGFVKGVIDLYYAMQADDRDRAVGAYEQWGFKNLSNDLIDTLNIWAQFIYGPMLDDRERTIADGISPGDYGRKEAFRVHSKLRELGPVRPPREFVFMDRAAIGLGAVFLHLDAKLNFYRLFNEAIDAFDVDVVTARQADAFNQIGVPLPT